MILGRAFCVRGARVLGAPGSPTTVRVVDGVIEAVGADGTARPGDVVHTYPGATVMPGLIDAHVHLGPGSSRLAALHGVTTVVDQFSTPALIAGEAARRDAARPVAHADVRPASVGATAPGGHPSMAYAPIPFVTGPGEADEFVAARVREGATHLKIIYDDGLGAEMDLEALSADTIRALVEAARSRGLVTVAHVSSSAGAVLVAGCGVDVLAHVPFEVMSGPALDAVAASGAAVIATLSIADGFPRPDGRLPLEADPVLAPRLTPAWRRVLRAQAQRWMPPTGPDAAAASSNVRELHRRGVRVLAGTDAPNPGLVTGLSLHRELHRLVEGGLSPQEALDAATSVAAEVFGLHDRGRIAPGARADLLVVDGDPVTDLAATSRILHAWVAGVEVVPAPADREAEAAQIGWIRATNEKIMAAVRELWPQWAPERRPEVIHLTGEDAVDEHLPRLTHPDKDARQQAAVQLGTTAHPAAAPALVARLGDESDFFVRETLTWAVTRVAPAALPLLEARADSPDRAVRLQALHALGKIAARSSVPVLGRHTGDADPGVAAKARSALARIADPETLPLLVRHLGEGSAEARAQLTTDIASFGAEAAPSAAAALADPDAGVRQHAADVLCFIGSPAAGVVAALVEVLDDAEPDVRLAAASALVEMGPEGRARLTGARDHPDTRVRAIARRVAGG